MKHVQMLGFDCPACRKTYHSIEEVARDMAREIRLEKVDDPARMLAFRVMAPPGVVVNDTLVYSGGVPDRRKIEGWLSSESDTSGG